MPAKKKPAAPNGAAPNGATGTIPIHCQYDRLVEPSSLRFNPANDNTHSPEQLERIAAVFREIGIRHPIIVSRGSGMVVVGEGRARAALLIPGCLVPVAEQDFSGEAEELAFLAADNKLSSLATRKESATIALFERIRAATPAFNLAGTGYVEKEIARLKATVREKVKNQKRDVSEFGVLVYAKDAAAQKEIFDRLTKEGHNCKIVCC
jgi:hypothetical protein